MHGLNFRVRQIHDSLGPFGPKMLFMHLLSQFLQTNAWIIQIHTSHEEGWKCLESFPHVSHMDKMREDSSRFFQDFDD